MSMIPPDDGHESLSLSDALAASRESESVSPEIEAAPEVAAPIVPAEAPWEAPAWASRWKPEARDALGRFAQNPELKQFYDPLRAQLEETNGYVTKRDQEFADYRKRLDPVYSILQPYEQRYRLQGQSLEQGVSQLFEAAELLGSNPDAAFPWLAGTYRPRDPQSAINQLAQQWGVDLNSVLSEQPYIDPTITSLLTPLQQQVQQLTQRLTQQDQQSQYQNQQALVSEISDFEAAKDDNGQLLHPHFAAVFDDMTALVNMGRAKDLPTAYKLATQFNPELQSKQQEQLAASARQKAIEEATARTVAAEKSEKASRTVVGKSRSGNQALSMSLREAFDKAEAQHGS